MKDYIEIAMLAASIIPIIILLFKNFVYSSQDLEIIATSKSIKTLVLLLIIFIFAFIAVCINNKYSSINIVTIIILIIDTYFISLIKFGINKNIIACSKQIRILDINHVEIIAKKNYFIVEYEIGKKVYKQKYKNKDLFMVKELLKIN